MQYFWNVKTCVLNMWKKCEKMWNNVKQMYFLKQFWGFVLFSFFIWFDVFAPGSHCFAIAKFNRSAICTVHFRSIWTAPLRFSTCRSWAGSKVTAAKLEPKKIKPEEKEIRVPPSQLDFQTFFHIFSHFFIFAFFHIWWRPKDPNMSVSSASAIVQDNVTSTNEENDLKAKPQRNWVFVEGSEYVSDIVPVVSSWTQSTVSEDDRDNFQRCSHRSNWNVLWCRKVVQEGVM